MKVLVTGGNGYLGTTLVGMLLERGHEVTILDKMLYSDKTLVTCNHFIKGDVRDKKTLKDALKDKDAVFHLAAIVGDEACDIKPRATRETNLGSSIILADMCETLGIKLLFASTCSVYGKNSSLLTEESPTDPVSWYGELKMMAEERISNVGSSLIFRLGTLFGLSPRMRYDLAVNLFIAKVLNGEKINVFGGNQWRPFLHVRDATKAFVFALEKDISGTFNASWKNYQISEAAKEIGKDNIEFSSDVHDARDYRADTNKLENVGFIPKLTIQDAIAEITNSESRLEYTNAKYSNFKTLLEKFKSGVFV